MGFPLLDGLRSAASHSVFRQRPRDEDELEVDEGAAHLPADEGAHAEKRKNGPALRNGPDAHRIGPDEKEFGPTDYLRF